VGLILINPAIIGLATTPTWAAFCTVAAWVILILFGFLIPWRMQRRSRDEEQSLLSREGEYPFVIPSLALTVGSVALVIAGFSPFLYALLFTTQVAIGVRAWFSLRAR
jgi:hypothetical protein